MFGVHLAGCEKLCSPRKATNAGSAPVILLAFRGPKVPLFYGVACFHEFFRSLPGHRSVK